jgi:hemolysin activation/secretion protein
MDRTLTGVTGDRKLHVYTAGLSGYTVADLPLFQGLVTFGATLGWGDVNQNDAAALTTDQGARRVEGSFAKLGYNLGLIQTLSQRWSLNASLRGQYAGKNLDSSERMSLGGNAGIRAYPGAEGTGDQGWQGSVNFNYQASGTLTTRLFYDVGQIWVNKREYVGWNAATPNLANRYDLQGVGLGFDWRFVPGATLALNLAAPLGNNPSADARGNDSDARRRSVRGWITVSAAF